jgi:hypothetical protein
MFRRYGILTLTLRQVEGCTYGNNLAGLPGLGAGERWGNGASHRLNGHDLFLFCLEMFFYQSNVLIRNILDLFFCVFGFIFAEPVFL